MAFINIYRASDDSLVTEDQTNPLELTLRADLNETDETRLYAQADSGYQVTGTEVSLTPFATTLSANAAAAQNVIDVNDASGYSKGSTILVGEGVNQEQARVDSINANQITLVDNLANSHTSGDAVVSATNTKWALAPDNAGSAGTYEADGDPLTLGTVGDDAGGRVHFWAKADATADEDPVNNQSVSLDVEGVAEVV